MTSSGITIRSLIKFWTFSRSLLRTGERGIQRDRVPPSHFRINGPCSAWKGGGVNMNLCPLSSNRWAKRPLTCLTGSEMVTFVKLMIVLKREKEICLTVRNNFLWIELTISYLSSRNQLMMTETMTSLVMARAYIWNKSMLIGSYPLTNGRCRNG